VPDKFKDIEELRGTGVPLTNIVLSTNPCPSCQECNGQSMTFDEWEGSPWGLPGSSGRLCEDDCHCILVPDEMMDELPDLGGESVKLRGDKDTDIEAIVEVGPDEAELKKLMEDWYAAGNAKLPKEIYDMNFEDIGPYLKKLLGKS